MMLSTLRMVCGVAVLIVASLSPSSCATDEVPNRQEEKREVAPRTVEVVDISLDAELVPAQHLVTGSEASRS